MVFPIAGGNESKGYEISNSVRFDKGSSPDLTRTFSNNSNKKTWTWSGWFKNCIGTHEINLLRYSPDDDTIDNIVISTSGNIQFQIRRAPTNHAYLNTNQLLRDPSAWYHLVVVLDTTQSTDSNRVKFYLNGNQITSFANSIYPDQNHEGAINSNVEHTICKFRETGGDGTRYGDFYLAENHFIDGTAKAQTDFGEFDDNGVWVPKKYTGSYGNNGYYLEFQQTGTSQNSSGIGADTSGNDNHFAPTNLAATDITEDTCTNNFATFNPLYVDRFANTKTLSEGNCEVDYPNSGNDGTAALTQAVDNGKWYIEMKVIDSAGFYPAVGSINENASQTVPYGRLSTGLAIAYDTNGTLKYENSNTSYGNSVSNGDIFQIALDMDNHLVWFGINGTWQNSATQTEIENSTATNDATTKVGEQTFLTDYDDITIFVGDVNSDGTANIQLNTGNPPFSISSGNTDGKYGNFEYAPPSGYYALCTKRLAEFG